MIFSRTPNAHDTTDTTEPSRRSSRPQPNKPPKVLSPQLRSTQPSLSLYGCHALRNHNALNAQAMDLLIQLSNQVDLKVLYSSAAACSIPKHMAYLGRLGIGEGSPFPSFDSLSKALRQHGASLMELMTIEIVHFECFGPVEKSYCTGPHPKEYSRSNCSANQSRLRQYERLESIILPFKPYPTQVVLPIVEGG